MSDRQETESPRDECARCGGEFLVELCDVGGGAGAPRDRIEAYLCYECRKETPNERLTGGD